MAGHDARAIANHILDMAKEQGREITVMQLLKLIYIANGWSWALLGKQLVRDPVEAWQYGPVYRSVYRDFNKFGSQPITEKSAMLDGALPYSSPLMDDERELLRGVTVHYGKLHAFRLSDMTHEPGTPWSQIKENKGTYAEIPQKLIKSHFEKLRDDQRERRRQKQK